MTETTDGAFQLRYGGVMLQLLAQRAIWRPDNDTLYVADVHAGKEAVFGRHGLAIPAGSTEADLARLFALGDRLGCRRIVVLGDLMHHVPVSNEHWLEALSAALSARPAMQLDVVAGNHDHRDGQARLDSRIRWLAEGVVDAPLLLRHHPATEATAQAVLAGHVHPGLYLQSRRRNGVRVPVFHLGPKGLVLPAFGGFTGLHCVQPTDGERVFVVGSEYVVEAEHVSERRHRGGR